MARERLHLTQAEIAQRAALPLDTWRKWEQGHYRPTDFLSIAKLIRLFGSDAWPILELLGIQRDDLLAALPERPAEPPRPSLIARPTVQFVMPHEWELLKPAADQEFVYDLLPLLRDPAAAGPGREIAERDVESWVAIHRSQTRGRRVGEIVCVRLSGHSMEPVLPHGSIVAVDTSRRMPDLRRRRAFLVSLAGEVTAKLLRRAGPGVEITAYNVELWLPRTLSWGAVDILGSIIWWWARAE